jgi:hypothetical protein
MKIASACNNGMAAWHGVMAASENSGENGESSGGEIIAGKENGENIIGSGKWRNRNGGVMAKAKRSWRNGVAAASK